MFFPGSGGKSKKAEAFCGGCPVRNKCLEDALTPGVAGFFAGTTEKERKHMSKFVKTVKYALADTLPPEPERKVVKRKPVPRTNVLHHPIDDLRGPTLTEEMDMLAASFGALSPVL